MRPKDVERIANSVDSDQISLVRIYNVCSDKYVPIFRIFTVALPGLRPGELKSIGLRHCFRFVPEVA